MKYLSPVLPFRTPPVSTRLRGAWSSKDACGMTLGHQECSSAPGSFGMGVKVDHISLASPPPPPWDPGMSGFWGLAGLFLVQILAHKPNCFSVLLNLGQVVVVSPRTLAWAAEGL